VILPRVLVIDDEPSAVDGLRTLLSLDGFDVDGSTSSLDGLGRLEHASYDALITDLEMPVLHGVELIERARRLVPTLPVIVVTAYDVSSMSSRARAAGACCVLGKPVRYERLLAELRSALQLP